MLFLTTFSYSLTCAIMPRFIIGIRELYDRDIREQWQGVDTGFGRSLVPSSRGNGGVSATAFGSATLVGGRAGDAEAIALGEVRDDVWQA